MQVNLLWPLRCLPWFTYVSILLFIQIIVIIPLSTLLWHEFYSQMVPPESRYSADVPQTYNEWSSYKEMHFNINWVDSIASNGIIIHHSSPSERKYTEPKVEPKVTNIDLNLPKNVPYYLTFSLRVYCFTKPYVGVRVRTIKINDYVSYRDVVCYGGGDNYEELSPQQIRKRYVNELNFPDVMITPSMKTLNVSLEGAGEIAEGSKFYLDRQLTGIRYLMLRWSMTCHTLGLLTFVTIVSCWFYFSFAIAFTIIALIFQGGNVTRSKLPAVREKQ